MRRLVCGLTIVLCGCASLPDVSSVSSANPDPREALSALERGDAERAATSIQRILGLSRHPGTTTVRREVLDRVAPDPSRGVALGPVEEAILLLSYGTALYQTGDPAAAALRARQALYRNPDLPADLRCWGLQVLSLVDPSEVVRHADVPGCVTGGSGIRVRFGDAPGMLRDRALHREARRKPPWHPHSRSPEPWVPGYIMTEIIR